jgi:hypothetical protein
MIGRVVPEGRERGKTARMLGPASPPLPPLRRRFAFWGKIGKPGAAIFASEAGPN